MSSAPAKTASGRRRPVPRGRPGPGAITTSAVLLVLAAVLVYRLGPALVGDKVFGAMALLNNMLPWSNGGPLLPVTNNALSDQVDTILPSYLDIHQRLFGGDLPLSTDLTGPGTTLLADSAHPVLTPTTVWFLLLPTSYATAVVKVAEVAVAVAGMALWLRRIGTGWTAGLLAGVIYVGSGFFASFSTWPAQAGTAALLPALFWGVERLVQERTARSLLVVAAAVAFLLLGGFPAVAGQGLYFAGLYLLVRLVADRHLARAVSGVRTFALAVGALVLGVGLAAVQLVPLTVGLVGIDLSTRADSFSATLPFRSALTAFYPGAFVDVSFPAANLIESYAYLGAAPVVLGAVALLTRRDRTEARAVVPFLTLAALVAVSLIYRQGWWNSWVGALPVFEGNPIGRLRAVLALLVAGLAGIGAHRILTALDRRGNRVRALAALLAGGTVFGVATVLVGQRYAVLLEGRRAVYEDAAWALATVAVLVVAVLLAHRRRARTVAFVVVAALLGVQANASVSNFWPVTDRSLFYPQLGVTQALAQVQGQGRIYAPLGQLLGSTASVYGLRSVTAHTFQPQPWVDYLTAIDPDVYGTGRTYTNPALSIGPLGSAKQDALLDRMGVTGYLQPARVPVPGPSVDARGAATPAAGSSDEPGTVELGPGRVVRTTVEPTSLRAVTVEVAQGATDTVNGVSVEAQLRASAGGPVLATGRVTGIGFGAGSLQIPVAAEGLGVTGPLDLTLTATAPLQLVTAGGRPSVQVTTSGGDADGVRLVYADDHGTVWERSNPLDRVRWASGALVVPDPAARLAAVGDPTTPRDEVVLAEPGPVPAGAGAGVDVTADDGDRVRVSVDAAGGGYLVVADALQTGWSATVDGVPAPLVDADYAFGGVWVPAGRHDVELRFTGTLLGPSLAVTGLSLLVVLTVLVVGGRRRRRG